MLADVYMFMYKCVCTYVCMCVTNTFHVFENNSKTMYTINICPILVASYCGIAARLMTTDLFTTKQKRAKKITELKKEAKTFHWIRVLRGPYRHEYMYK